jgi:predicted acylesterase/phospholipase RssA
MSTFSIVDISYETFPDWSVVESVYASSCAPVLFKPFKKNGVWYSDGGILANCPLKQLCESKIKPKCDQILSITTEKTEFKKVSYDNYIDSFLTGSAAHADLVAVQH